MTSNTFAARTPSDYVWTVLRIGLGWVFLWAFLDKTFGLGFSTPAERAWVNGGSPTFGFLSNTSGWFADVFQALAGITAVDVLFMAGLFGVGLSLLLGIAIRIGAYAGIALMALMWLAVLPPSTNPILDDHVIYALALWGVAVTRHTQALSLERYWVDLPFVKAHPALQ